MTVVLVEDHHLLRDQLCQLLTAAGLVVVHAAGTLACGQQAIVRLRPRVAVIDNHLPDGRGIDLCRALAALAPDVAVLIHSSTVSDQDRSDALTAGALDVIPKSISCVSLLQAIASLA